MTEPTEQEHFDSMSHHTIVEIPIHKIHVGIRRRDEDGDIDTLAASIRAHGLLHPIAIDRDHNLVCGGRRLKAFVLLGRDTIPAIIKGKLSEDERRILELEENQQRKDFTLYEQAKTLVDLAQKTRNLLANEFPLTVSSNSGKGRKSRGTAREKVVERLQEQGISVTRNQLSRAERRVAVVAEHPELMDTSQRQTLKEDKPKSDGYQFAANVVAMMDRLVSEKRYGTHKRVLEDAVVLLYSKEFEPAASVEAKNGYAKPPKGSAQPTTQWANFQPGDLCENGRKGKICATTLHQRGHHPACVSF